MIQLCSRADFARSPAKLSYKEDPITMKWKKAGLCLSLMRLLDNTTADL